MLALNTQDSIARIIALRMAVLEKLRAATSEYPASASILPLPSRRYQSGCWVIQG